MSVRPNKCNLLSMLSMGAIMRFKNFLFFTFSVHFFLIFVLSAQAQENPQVDFKLNRLASKLLILEALSKSQDDDISTSIKSWWDKRHPLTELQKGHIKSFLTLRRTFFKRHEANRKPERLPEGAEYTIPPTPGQDSMEAFRKAFLETDNLQRAAVSLFPLSEEAAEMVEIFECFDKQIEAGIIEHGKYQEAISNIVYEAQERKMSDFLCEMAKFYEVQNRIPKKLFVHFLWLPSGEDMAPTQVDRHMWIPISSDLIIDGKFPNDILNIVVHEFGHFFMALQKPDLRYEVAARIAFQEGLVNPKTINIFDEALQTALGSICFGPPRDSVKNLQTPLYGFCRNEPFPDAIDTLSRSLAPIVRSCFKQKSPFLTFLAQGLKAQKSLFGRRPAGFTPVCKVYSPHRLAIRWFKGLFPSYHRSNFLRGQEAEFVATSENAAEMPRWILLIQKDWEENPDIFQNLNLKVPKKLLEDFTPDGCIAASQAFKRNDSVGLDIFILARDLSGLRIGLLSLHRSSNLPQETPLILRNDSFRTE